MAGVKIQYIKEMDCRKSRHIQRSTSSVTANDVCSVQAKTSVRSDSRNQQYQVHVEGQGALGQPVRVWGRGWPTRVGEAGACDPALAGHECRGSLCFWV